MSDILRFGKYPSSRSCRLYSAFMMVLYFLEIRREEEICRGVYCNQCLSGLGER
jgi:hypothetical protein